MFAHAGQQDRRRRLSLASLSLVLGLLLTGGVALFNSSPSATAENSVTICHATGSETNPYVLIIIGESALPAHLDHGDLYPAPPSGCPAGVSPTQTPTETPTETPTATAQPTPTLPPDPGPD